jgi:hypothetical protein
MATTSWISEKVRECREERDRLASEASAARAVAQELADRVSREADDMEREAMDLDALVSVLDPRGRYKR